MPGLQACASVITSLGLLVLFAGCCGFPSEGSQASPRPPAADDRTPFLHDSISLASPVPVTSVPVAVTATRRTTQREGQVTLRVIFDSEPLDPRLQTGWGFSVWVEVGDSVILFDTGADGSVLLGNMAALGLDPRAVDIVFLSHSHDDHTGGLAAILSANPQVAVYLPYAFPATIRDRMRSSGANMFEVDGPLEILPGLWSTGQMGTSPAEQALVARTVQGLVVVTGCAHPGVDRVVVRSREIGEDEVHLVVGGFHLGGASERRIKTIIEKLQGLGVQQVAPGHCAGDGAKDLFRSEYGKNYHDVGVGWQWRSEAAIWKPSGEGIPAQVGVAAVTVAPSDTGVVYLATYEPDGLFRSTDSAGAWQAVGAGLGQLTPLSVAVHPTDPDVVWVGTMAGGFHTRDGGQHWDKIPDLPKVPIYALAATSDGSLLYAGGEAAGVWRSDDDGQTWLPNEMTDGHVSVLSLEIAADGMVYAGTAGQGLWVGVDEGTRWRDTGHDLSSANVAALAATPGDRLYVLGDGHLYRSRDDGSGWEECGPQDFQGLSFAVAPGLTDHLYLGSKGQGVRVSRDGGTSWNALDQELSRADITCLEAVTQSPELVYLGTRHNGLYRTTDGGESWELASIEVGHPVIAALAQDPQDANTFYAGALDGIYQSVDGGLNWQLISADVGKVSVQDLAVGPTGEEIYAGTRTGIYMSNDRGRTWTWLAEIGPISIFDIIIDPHDERRIYAGSWGHNVLRSIDGGRSWASIHRGLETLSAHAVAVDPNDPQRLYVGTVESIYRSIDGGQSWQASPLAGRALTVFALTFDPANPAGLFAGTTEGVYHSLDQGQTWQSMDLQSLSATVTDLAVGPPGRQGLYAGTEHHGVFRSQDGGVHWQQWGLEGTSVYSILVDLSGSIWLGTDQGILKEVHGLATP
jgi:7,8-dihydropterin-6-yl-methyl-4-(beta-D-ribofuranosyl)aminobenzene 5'-phosphate synthase